METLLYCIGLSGTAAFAVTAVLVVATRPVDLLSAIVFGIITAVGGGTIRDLTLDVPVFWVTDANYLWVAIVASVATFFTHTHLTRKLLYQLVLYIDGLGAALFAVFAADKAISLGFAGPLVPIILGGTTAIGGGSSSTPWCSTSGRPNSPRRPCGSPTPSVSAGCRSCSSCCSSPPGF
mgnify:CR=1 FL=1